MKQGEANEIGGWLDRAVLRGSASYGAWEWARSFVARPHLMDFKRASVVKAELDAALKPWSRDNGGHQDFLIKEEWDKGTATTLGQAFAAAAPKYTKAGMLHHHIDVLATGIDQSSARGLHGTNQNLSAVFGCLLPVVLHPKTWAENRRAWGTYYDHLARFMGPGAPSHQGPKPYAHGLPDALKTSVDDCDKHKLWPGLALRDEITGLMAQHTP